MNITLKTPYELSQVTPYPKAEITQIAIADVMVMPQPNQTQQAFIATLHPFLENPDGSRVYTPDTNKVQIQVDDLAASNSDPAVEALRQAVSQANDAIVAAIRTFAGAMQARLVGRLPGNAPAPTPFARPRPPLMPPGVPMPRP